jgi:DNA (cytosine-5)-methyltransferase 1
MSGAYYNEIEPHTAQWLRNLIADGHIAPGEVDERSIADVRADDLRGFTQCHFFAGIGGWSCALRLAGWDDARPVWTGSCPCQPYSAAGLRKGDADGRNLWPVFFNLIRQCRPDAVFGEQVEAAVRFGWFDGIRADLEGENYALGLAVLGAHSAGAKHIRQRAWWVADAKWDQQPRQEPRRRQDGRVGRQHQPFPWDEPWRGALSRLRTLDDGVPRCVAGTDAARNAISPEVGAMFIEAYCEGLAA